MRDLCNGAAVFSERTRWTLVGCSKELLIGCPWVGGRDRTHHMKHLLNCAQEYPQQLPYSSTRRPTPPG